MNTAEGLTAEAVKDVAKRLGLLSVDLEAVRISYARILKEQKDDPPPACMRSDRAICFSPERNQQAIFESLGEDERLIALAIQNALALGSATLNAGRTRDSESRRERSPGGQSIRQSIGASKTRFR